MKKLTFPLIAGLFAILLGCANTVEGVKKDAEEASRSTEKTMEKTSEQMGETARDIGAAATLTPLIKNAIIADPTLNDSGNNINVETTEEKVTLKGHVRTTEMKMLAQSIAERTLLDKKATQTVDNQLEIRPSS
ncbi:MAG: hypothetical protein HONBIEJF_02452 [Fimbriimonadaceae bacterium]|nr:hypothetical protein [Fimbriimonadaceae bacterium]